MLRHVFDANRAAPVRCSTSVITQGF